MSDSRLEKFIYAICSMDVTDLPVPLSRIETLWNCLITGETPDFEPLSRNEKYLMAMLDCYDISNLPAPMSRGEKLLYKIAVGETDLSDVPGYLSRYEELLKYLIENGGISGGDFEYVLYTLNQSLYTLYATAEKPVKRAVIHGDTLVNALQESSSLAVTPMGEDIDAQQASVTGTANGAIKSAILKGDSQRVFSPTKNLFDGELEQGTINSSTGNNSDLSTAIRSKNFVEIGVNTAFTLSRKKGTASLGFRCYDKNKNFLGTIFTAINGGTLKVTYTTDSNTVYIRFIDNTNDLANEYQIEIGSTATDYEEPNYELKSVKMPVLTTTGKNLFNKTKVKYNTGINMSGIEFTDSNANKYVSSDFIEVKENTFYYIQGMPVVMSYDKNKEFLKIVRNASTNGSFTTPNGCKYIRIRNWNHLDTLELQKEIVNITQLEEGSIVTSYEPYKSNILTVNEDVELRGIGDVKDELNLLTGELTQRIGENVLDGSERWESHAEKTNTRVFKLIIDKIKHIDHHIISDRFLTNAPGDVEKITNTANVIYLAILRTKADNLKDFKSYLSQNPMTVRYQLAKESIKTVDLTVVDQDGNTVPHLQAFNETTHISTSSTGLIPNVVIPATVSYPSIIEPSTLYTVKLKRPVTSGSLTINVGGTEQAVTSDCFTMTTPNTLTSQDVVFSGKGNVISEVTVVEGDQTAKEYGYFEGMQTVKMPVLTTTGKNLFNTNLKLANMSGDGVEFFSSAHVVSADYIAIIPNTQYYFSCADGFNTTAAKCIYWYDANKKFIKQINETGTSPSNACYCKLRTRKDNTSTILESEFDSVKMQLEEGNQATSYEPYKSNILTVNEEVELRGIGEVKDELDCLTGELTQRVSGLECINQNSKLSQSGTSNDTTLVITTSLKSTSTSGRRKLVASHELIKYVQLDNWYGNLSIIFRLPKSNKNFATLANFKQYLTQNPFYYYRELEQNEKSIKTVDLTVVDQDNQPTELGTFENITHVSLEAENLIPEVEMEVATNLLEDTVFNLTNAFNTLYSTAEKPVKSAILTGNSIKIYKNNLFDNVLEKGTISISTGEPNNSNLRCYRSVNFIPINGNFKIAKYGIDGDLHVCFYDSNKSFITGQAYVLRKVLEGNATVTPPTNSSFIKFYNPYDDNEPTGGFGFGVMAENEIIELEIQSVKMPVLTTTGKNLFDMKNSNFITEKDGNYYPSSDGNLFDTYTLLPNTTYTISGIFGGWGKCLINGVGFGNFNSSGKRVTKKFTTDSTGVTTIFFGANTPTNALQSCYDFQLEIGDVFTAYEPHKSNILTVNEDVTLRSNGSVYDELDLLTGKLTQRIDEDGSVLTQEVVKTVDLTVVDQDSNATSLSTFDDTTHVLLDSEGLIPNASLTVRTKIPTASSTNLLMDTVSTEQEQLNTTVNEQSENVDATLIATTEIYEGTL